jgi:hypothetical protein
MRQCHQRLLPQAPRYFACCATREASGYFVHHEHHKGSLQRQGRAKTDVYVLRQQIQRSGQQDGIMSLW